MLTGLNHITLSVSQLEHSLDFYQNLLGFKAHVKWDNGAYLSLPGLWLCLSLGRTESVKDYTHFAFSLSESDYERLVIKLKQYGVKQWQENTSEGESFYFLDPDGHKLELHLGSLETRLAELKTSPYQGLVWL
ncbi:probable fosfomycin resistance protein [Marinomonas sp. MED121]|uniref:fosfomycin resistance glutathione transferase n=1 Tax=Marinomonas sp. MED121 TaxID=314277 RepID=UPI00006901DA|nr:fosfomycin resistance glutathione transferase [Marinomonas sp. MED121]EAQ64461.1 probable fosfomycin resistance protein [Marinomonas sp. MED121]